MKHQEIWQAPALYKHLLELDLKKKVQPTIRSGIATLDNYIKDFSRGEITVISGKTGHGKTTFAITLTANMCDAGLICLWFSYELGPLDFLRKTMDSAGNIPGFFLPYQLIPNDLKYIDFKIQECKKEYGIDVVFIDHLHYLCDLTDLSITLELGRVMRWLKQTAIKYEIAIFLLCHIKKLTDFKLKELDNDHLKDSSSIAQDADNVFFIVRTDKSDNSAVLKITKNRRQGYRNKYIYLNKIGNYLYETEEDDD